MLLQRLGYWGEAGSGLPAPSALIDDSWNDMDRDLVAEHLGRGFVARAYTGHATCRVCGDQVGSLELTDGTYIWPEGLRHYVAAHSIRLPERFVEHVRTFTDEIEGADVDDSWWRSLAD
ncbi:hypothetical protein [Actinomadura verrucosospora]|uniref:hypothetical protein n=1 Tax=Actinomadura verrucosospora TaxID=46165 RepID=UPI0015662CC0|nr:hypothetical protein [Actinomadura verrucosospora]